MQKLSWVLLNNDWHLIYNKIILGTANGGVFRNKVIKNYLKENNIDHITGGPYNLQHQGAVEAFNKTIQDFFYQLRIIKRKKFCLVDSINGFLIYYNERRHSTNCSSMYPTHPLN